MTPARPYLSHALAIEDISAPGHARRSALRLARELGFSDSGAGRVALVATELATNIFKHARRGELLLRALAPAQPALELLALDAGPGMENVAACLRDGYSSAGSPGTGLGAIARLAQSFDVYSSPRLGTAVLARLHEQPGKPDGLDAIGAVCLPMPGESACGDAWAIDSVDGTTRALIADGLGHGPLAAQAAEVATETFGARSGADAPKQLLERLHAALRRTRGAAVATAHIDPAHDTVCFAGVGNIVACIAAPADGECRRLVSQNGTAGLQIRRTLEFTYPWPPGATLIAHSDGLATQWQISRYPGLLARHPALLAGVLYRDYRRGRDDVTVLVVRDQRRP